MCDQVPEPGHQDDIEPARQISTNEENQLLRDLAAGLTNGDREAAARLVVEYGTRIRRRLRGKLNRSMRSLMDTDDVLAMTYVRFDQFIQAHPNHSLRPEEIKALFRKIFDNSFIDAARKANAVAKSESVYRDTRVVEQREQMRRTHWNNPPDPKEVLADVRMSITDRTILDLRLQQQSFRQIAKQVHLTESTVRQRWCRLKARLSHRFNTHGESGSHRTNRDRKEGKSE